MKLIVDMNLSPAWVGRLGEMGWLAEHWSGIGDPRAPDRELLAEVAHRGACLLTADLDFGAILAASGGRRPSVVVLRFQDPTPDAAIDAVTRQLERFRGELSSGALLSIDERGGRVRLLPLR